MTESEVIVSGKRDPTDLLELKQRTTSSGEGSNLLVDDLSQKQTARIAGFGWLLIIFTGIIGEFMIRMTLIDVNDASATAANIVNSSGQFKLSIVLDIIMIIADIIVGWALYKITKPINRSLALLSTMLRFAMAVIISINLLNLVIVLLILGDPSYLSSFDTDQLHSLAMLFINAHGHGYDISLVFFGLHLMLLGYLFFKSDYLPRIPGFLLIFASVGYIVDSFANLFLSGDMTLVSTTAMLLLVIAIVAELTISGWLILRGHSIPEMQSSTN